MRKSLTALAGPLAACALAAAAVAAPAFAFGAGCSSTPSESTDLHVDSIIFIKRVHTTVDPKGAVDINVAGGNGQVIDYERYVPGGSLVLLAPARADGTVHNLSEQFPAADFNGVDVSYDAKQAVFSMKKDANDRFHLYTVQLTAGANGKYEIHQKTTGDYDDINPIYMPGGRIAFVTNQAYTEMGTRADEYEHARVVTQLASISVDGGDADRHLFSQNLSHTVAPFMRFDGKIGYSRWEHLGGVNDVKLFTANPDGTNMIAIAGEHGKPGNALVNVRETEPNVMVGITTTRSRTIHAGALVQIDARNAKDPVCMDPKADKIGHACLDEENVKYTILTPDVPTGSGPSPVGRYREPSALPDGRLLVSFADGPVNDLSEQSVTPPDFGLYVFDPVTKKNKLVYNDRDKWDLGALAVYARKEPPVIGDLQKIADSTQPVRMGSIDVTQTSLTDTVTGAQFNNTPLNVALNEAAAVRIIEGFSSEGAKGVSMFGLTMHEGAAVLGEATVYNDKSWLANIPPYVPVHLQPIDKFGLSIRSQGLWIQGMPGEDRRCVGCHESRVGQGVPRFGANPTVAEQRQAQSFMQPIAERTELPWDKNDTAGKLFVQDILTRKCASCHNESTSATYTVSRTDPATGIATAYPIPVLDLSARQVTAYYDREVKPYNASYVSIFYPAAMEMGKVTVVGTVPPKWGIPGSARESKLIEKINIKAADGSTAWPTPLHPEDKSINLTDEERRALILAMDLGGQYYARQNTQFTPLGNGDPVAPGKKY
jgi:Hydrazine synthase alpha subunit middle domain